MARPVFGGPDDGRPNPDRGDHDKKGHRQRDGNPKHTHFHREAGLMVSLRHIPGKTKKELLKRPFYFQNGPLDSFGWEKSHAWEDYVTITRGTFTREGGRELKTITFNSLVVDYNPSWAALAGGQHHRPGNSSTRDEPGGEAPKPIAVGDYLERLLDSGTPFRLIARNAALWGRPEIDMAVSLRSVNVVERAGEVDSRYFDLSFTEYREPRMKRRGYGKDKDLPVRLTIDRDGVAYEDDGKKKPEKNPEKIGSPSNPATLRRIAKKYYHDSGKWREIAQKNGIKHFGADESLADLYTRGRQYRRITVPRIDRPIDRPEPKDGKGKGN